MKIGFLALSGIRVVDPVLQTVGLNLPGFVERSKVIASLPSLGLLTLAGLTPAYHEIRYVDIPDVDAPDIAAQLPEPFDVVAISSFTAMAKDAYRLGSRYRAAGVKVILGGLHVTLCPDEAAAYADAIVVGEGEPVWPTVLSDLEAGRLQPRYRTSVPFDLADAPMPRFDLLDVGKYLDRIRRIQDQGITVNGCLVLGLDTHTEASFDRIWEFVQKSELYEIQLTILTPFPGTPLYERFARDGRLLETGAWEKCTLFDVTYRPAQLSPDALRRGFLDLASKVYSAEFTDLRRRRFIRRKLANDCRAA